MTFSEYIDGIKDKRIGVIGIGVSNTPLIEKLLERGCDVTACDKGDAEALGADYESGCPTWAQSSALEINISMS